jgi:hypothetical protein
MKPLEAGFDLFQGNLNGAVRTYWVWDYHVFQDAGTPPDDWRTGPAPVRSLPGIAPTTYAPVVNVADAMGRSAATRCTHWTCTPRSWTSQASGRPAACQIAAAMAWWRWIPCR